MSSSPCKSVCRIHEESRLCLGCGRTLREIGGWGAMTEAERLAIMAQLPERLRNAPADAAPPVPAS